MREHPNSRRDKWDPIQKAQGVADHLAKMQKYTYDWQKEYNAESNLKVGAMAPTYVVDHTELKHGRTIAQQQKQTSTNENKQWMIASNTDVENEPCQW
mmetsp:Transcript_50852/g.80617  ORF Transcript_50852/g.80617 Transcript_50852/m.80617 type:complete len:98 (-) Transcript_50852:2096-2389(-)